LSFVVVSILSLDLQRGSGAGREALEIASEGWLILPTTVDRWSEQKEIAK
jgi:hypothetical protein